MGIVCGWRTRLPGRTARFMLCSGSLREIGLKDVDELYSGIPDELKFKRKFNLPEPLLAEYELKKTCSTNSI